LFALTVAWNACADSAAPVHAQAFPTRPIRIVVANAPGSSPDFIARAIARPAEAYLGQNVIVDNRAGANGIIAAVIVAKAAADGYTVLHTPPAFLISPLIYRKLQYDVHRDFVPVTTIATGVGFLMLVHPSLRAHTIKEFVALAKQKSLAYGSPPPGNTTHLAMELFKVRAGVDLRHIAYKGGADTYNALLGGEIQVTFSPPTAALSHVQPGRMRALGFSGSKRFGRLPEVPLISEAGAPDFVVDFTWNAWFAPAKTPPAVVNKLQAAVREALKAPRILEFLDAAAFYPVGSTPAVFREFVDAEMKRYAQIVRDAKIALQ
jgi:tripartite-type tricarboxylate transporter receptor subunit TctC